MNPVMSQEDEIRRIAKVVDSLRERIKKHDGYLRGKGGKETRTRALLIDPLLRALHWDPENPDQVRLEFKVENGIPDYALFKEGLPVALIEAKGHGENLDTKDPGQVIRYTTDPNCESVSLVVFTNGVKWVFFRESGGWEAESVEMTSSDRTFTALGLVNRLDRSGLNHRERASGRPASVGKGRTVGNWYQLGKWMPRDKQPTAIRFEHGAPKRLRYWYDMYLVVARNLLDSGALTRSMVPVITPGGTRYLVNDSPKFADDKDFANPKEIVGGLWLDAFGGARMLPWKSAKLIEACGGDPGTVEVRFD